MSSLFAEGTGGDSVPQSGRPEILAPEGTRMGIGIGRLLEWTSKAERRGTRWERTIKAQREALAYLLGESPSRKARLADPRWINMIRSAGSALARSEAGLERFPEDCVWSMTDEIPDIDG